MSIYFFLIPTSDIRLYIDLIYIYLFLGAGTKRNMPGPSQKAKHQAWRYSRGEAWLQTMFKHVVQTCDEIHFFTLQSIYIHSVLWPGYIWAIYHSWQFPCKPIYIYSYIVSKQDDASPSMETRNMCYQSPFGHYVPWLCLRRNALTSLPLQLRRWLTWPTGFTQVPAQFFPVLQRRIPKSQTLVWFKTVFLSISFEYVSHAILPGYHEWKIIPCFFPYIGSCVITIIFMDYRDCTTIFSLLITTFT